MTKPLNQEEKDRLAAYKEQFKGLGESQTYANIMFFARFFELKTQSFPEGSNERIVRDGATKTLFDYADLMARENL